MSSVADDETSSSMGFGFHSSRKWKAARDLFVSLFVFVAIGATLLSENRPWDELWSAKPAWFLGLAVFALFSIILATQLVRILRTPFVLEFTEAEIIDRRFFRRRVIPYSSIEIFSPEPQSLFKVEPAIMELRTKIGVEDYITVACRLRGDVPDFVFFEKVAPPPFEMQGAIVRRLLSKISKFDLLIYDEGDDIGEFDETNA